MATQVTIAPLNTYAAGTYPFGPIALPNGTHGFNVSVQRCTSANPTIWPSSTTTLQFDLQFSCDGGKTYSKLGENSAGPSLGGIITDPKTGQEVPAWVFCWRFSPVDATHVKGVITIAGGSVKTSATVTKA